MPVSASEHAGMMEIGVPMSQGVVAQVVRAILALATFGSGIVNLTSVLSTTPVARRDVLRDVFPLQLEGWSGHLTLLLGFVLVISSINIYKRKRRALLLVSGVALLSAVVHLSKRDTYGEAAASAALFVLLCASHRTFTVRSVNLRFTHDLIRIGLLAASAIAYSIAGFWFLDRRDFGIDFTVWDSVIRSVRFLGWIGDPTITPHTRFARWFLDSLYLTSAFALSYGAFALYRPAAFHLRTLPRERSVANALVNELGRDSLDYFKLWPDKSFFFSPSGRAFLSYRVGAGMAMTLGDPVGADHEIEPLLFAFLHFCDDNDWRPAFYQTTPEFLPIYRRLGLHKLKIGEHAIVNLREFTTAGREMKSVRATVNKLEKAGFTMKVFDPPHAGALLTGMQQVSDDWLKLPGRRERRFSLGRFDRGYLANTRLFGVVDTAGVVLAFANQIPSYRRGEATIDLMRHRQVAPNGVMDFLFVKLFAWCKDQGFDRFSLGMAPMSGFSEREEASAGERAVHAFIHNLNFVFSFRGLHHFKAKYASFWEPRYLVYRHISDLARVTVALRKVSEL